MALPQLKLDVETADLIAASKVRAAMESYVNPPAVVSELIQALYADGKIDEPTAKYILLHESRFTLCPAPVYFEAGWVRETQHESSAQ
jgi:hypothetical protein